MIIVGVIICSYAPPEVNINHLVSGGGSDFAGLGVSCDEQSAAEQEMWALAIACLSEALLSC